jgi:hypothetical protein
MNNARFLDICVGTKCERSNPWLLVVAGLSTNSDHRIVEGAGHYIHWDRPEAVIAAIRDIVTAVREGGPVRREAPGSGQNREIGDTWAGEQAARAGARRGEIDQ